MLSAAANVTNESLCASALPEKFVRASLLLFVSAMARLNCSRMLLSSDERCSVLCSATRRRSFKAWNSLWYAISFSITKTNTQEKKVVDDTIHHIALQERAEGTIVRLKAWLIAAGTRCLNHWVSTPRNRDWSRIRHNVWIPPPPRRKQQGCISHSLFK